MLVFVGRVHLVPLCFFSLADDELRKSWLLRCHTTLSYLLPAQLSAGHRAERPSASGDEILPKQRTPLEHASCPMPLLGLPRRALHTHWTLTGRLLGVIPSEALFIRWKSGLMTGFLHGDYEACIMVLRPSDKWSVWCCTLYGTRIDSCRGGGIEVRNFPQFSAIFRIFPQFFCFALLTCLQVTLAVFFSQCATVSKRQHKLDDTIRRLRFMLQFHGDIEGRLL